MEILIDAALVVLVAIAAYAVGKRRGEKNILLLLGKWRDRD